MTDRIKVTHVGSLTRPDDVIAIMRRLDERETVDPAEHQAVLARGPSSRRSPRAPKLLPAALEARASSGC